jgi:hypothetical protein
MLFENYSVVLCVEFAADGYELCPGVSFFTELADIIFWFNEFVFEETDEYDSVYGALCCFSEFFA